MSVAKEQREKLIWEFPNIGKKAPEQEEKADVASGAGADRVHPASVAECRGKFTLPAADKQPVQV